MENIITNEFWFETKHSDPLYKYSTNLDFKINIGDTVYFEFSEEERKNKARLILNADVQGLITEKWIDLSDNRIVWTVLIDDSYLI